MWWNEERMRSVSERMKKMRRWLRFRTEQKIAEYVIARNKTKIVKRLEKKR